MGGAGTGTGAGDATGGAAAPIEALIALPEMMRVNSPGSELIAGGGTSAASAGGCGTSAGGTVSVSCDSLRINLVTLPASAVEDSADWTGENEGSGSKG
jgi:hypothetical protein